MSQFSWYWSEKSHCAWAEVRKRGKWNFVIFKGLLGWGLPMFIVMACGPAFLGFPYRIEPGGLYWVWQPLLWSTSGLLYGMSTWNTSEKLFAKHELQPS